MASEVNRVNRTLQAVIQYVVDSLNEVARDGLQISSRQQDANANWVGLSSFHFIWWRATFYCCGSILIFSVNWAYPGMDRKILLHVHQGRLEVSQAILQSIQKHALTASLLCMFGGKIGRDEHDQFISRVTLAKHYLELPRSLDLTSSFLAFGALRHQEDLL